MNPCKEAFGLLQKGADSQQIRDALVQLLHGIKTQDNPRKPLFAINLSLNLPDRGCYTDYKPTGTYPSPITGFSNAYG